MGSVLLYRRMKNYRSGKKQNKTTMQKAQFIEIGRIFFVVMCVDSFKMQWCVCFYYSFIIQWSIIEKMDSLSFVVSDFKL